MDDLLKDSLEAAAVAQRLRDLASGHEADVALGVGPAHEDEDRGLVRDYMSLSGRFQTTTSCSSSMPQCS